MTTKAPAPGDLLVIDGVARKITAIERGIVQFDNPDDAPKRDEAGEKLNSSRAGSCRVTDLRWMDGVKVWYLDGRLAPPTPIDGAVVPQTADLKLSTVL